MPAPTFAALPETLRHLLLLLPQQHSRHCITPHRRYRPVQTAWSQHVLCRHALSCSLHWQQQQHSAQCATPTDRRLLLLTLSLPY
jgi:hypothetical protein